MKDWQLIEELPDLFFEIGPQDLYRCFPKPTLLHIGGQRSNGLFISTLLHGNETTGFFALQKFLSQRQQTLPRDLWILFGNIEAAREAKRHLPHQPDYNRIWEGDHGPEWKMASEIISFLRNQPIDLAIDIHNTTGRNPFYIAAPSINKKVMLYGELFSRHFVHYLTPEGTLASALNRALNGGCAAFVIECGQSGNDNTHSRVCEFIDLCLSRFDLHSSSVHPPDIDIYQSIAKIKLFPESDIILDQHFDLQNFSELEVEREFCKMKSGHRFEVLTHEGNDLFDEYFKMENKSILIKKKFIPSLLSGDPTIYRSDALGYVMTRKPMKTSFKK